MSADAFYHRAGPDRFEATGATAGPWDPGAQHAGPPSALLARAIEAHEPVPGQHLARVTVDIFRPVPVAPLTVSTRTVRPGRRVTLVEAVASAGSEPVLSARGWRIATPARRAPVPDVDDPVPPVPPAVPSADWPGVHMDGYLTAMRWRFVTGGFTQPGPAQVWMSPGVPLVAGEPTSPACLAMLVADSGNGVSGWLDPREWLFVNVDLTVALYRQPRGEWLLLDAATALGPDGAAVVSSRLADTTGGCGRAVQTLLVSPR